jgi:thioester reductase-like protein
MRLAATGRMKPFVFVSSLSSLGRRFADENFHFMKIDATQLNSMSGYGCVSNALVMLPVDPVNDRLGLPLFIELRSRFRRHFVKLRANWV